MIFLTLITITLSFGLVVFLISRSGAGNQGSLVQFFARGMDFGFSFKEIDLLRQLAIRSNIQPDALFGSQNQLDICIRAMVRNMRAAGEGEDTGTQDFLSRLYDFRKKIEIDKSRGARGIESSRQIRDGQPLRILVKGTGVFKSRVVKNTNQYLTLIRPTNDKVGPRFSWTGQKIAVYLWRDDDAGYVFDSEAQDEVFSRGISSLKIAHSDSLFRTQKRKSVRIKMHKPAFLYLMGLDEQPGKIEVVPGLKCFIGDLSDTGCAIIVGGKATAGLHIKAQFVLGNSPVTMSGIVRSVDIKEDGTRSTLHVEADPLPIRTRNKILGEIFGMLPEDEEDLPFRVMDDEMDGMEGDPRPDNSAGNEAGRNGGDEISNSPGVMAGPVHLERNSPGNDFLGDDSLNKDFLGDPPEGNAV